jgi:hypothetical protein
MNQTRHLATARFQRHGAGRTLCQYFNGCEKSRNRLACGWLVVGF